VAGDACAGADVGGHKRNLAELSRAVAVGVNAGKRAYDSALSDTDSTTVVQKGSLSDHGSSPMDRL